MKIMIFSFLINQIDYESKMCETQRLKMTKIEGKNETHMS